MLKGLGDIGQLMKMQKTRSDTLYFMHFYQVADGA